MRRIGGWGPVVLASVVASSAGTAQCPDGTPPPCDTRRPATLTPVRREPPAAADRARRFLIIPFRNVTRQADQDWLVEGSTTMLAEALGRWQGISVVGDDKLYPALKRAGIAPGTVAPTDKVRRVADETGGWTAVTGEVLATGGRVRITARAVDVPTNNELVRASSEIAAGGDVRLAFDSLSLRLLRAAGLDAVGTDLSGATTRNVDAYRAYLDGRANMRRAQLKPAIKAFQEATRLDSTFALGWVELAQASFSAEAGAILNPQSVSAQYLARGVALSGKLPPRDRQRMLATDAIYHAQFTDARTALEALVASDSNDVESLVALVGLEMFDPILVPAPGGVRPRGSLNRAARLAKRAAQLDPSRAATLSVLVTIYSQAGNGAAQVIGVERAPSSFPDLIKSLRPGQSRVYRPVLRDTIELVPLESLSVIPRDSAKTLQRNARAAALRWAERWVQVASGDAAPYATVSDLYMMQGDYPKALIALSTADSLGGVQVPGWSGAARRMQVLGRSGNYPATIKLADSLTAAGFFGNTNSALRNADAAAWAFAMHLLSNHVSRAAALYDQTVAGRRAFSLSSPEGQAYDLLMGNSDPEDEPALPRALRGMMLDTLTAHLNEAAASPQLGPWLQVMLPTLADIADPTKKRLPALLKATDGLATSAGGAHAQLAFALASNLVSADLTLEATAATYSWYRSGAEAFNAVKRATAARFTPASASVAADHAVFEWAVADSAPFPRNRAETPLFRPEYRWEITVDAGTRYYRLYVAGPSRVFGPPMSGTLADILPPTGTSVVLTGGLSGGVQRDTTQLQGLSVRTEIARGVLRLIVTDKAVVDALRTARPAQARFRFFPCVRGIGSTGPLECAVDSRVSISYP